MPPRKAQEKAIERAKLQEVREVTITFRATEEIITRIAALLLFAEAPHQLKEVKLTPMPWEDPADPRFQAPPVLEIDYEVVRRDITKTLSKALNDGIPAAELMPIIQTQGGETLAKVPQDNLLALREALHNRLNPKAPE